MQPDFWGFLEKYGYRYEGDHTRALLPCEVGFYFCYFTIQIASSFTCLQICWHLSIYDFLCADLSYFLHCIRPIYVFSLIVLVHDDFSLNIMPQYRNRHSSKWEIVGFSIMLCPKHHILILKDFLYWMICICYIYIFKTAFSSLHDKKWHWHIWEVWVRLLKCFWFAFTMICNWGFQANCCVLFFKYFNSLCLPTEIDYLAFG